MAKTSALTTISSNTSGDLLYVSQGATDRAITIDNFGIQGTFTATLTATTPPTTPPTAMANYTIVGNRVDLDIQFVSVDTTGGAGVLSITGIPAAIQPSVLQVGSSWNRLIATSTLATMAKISGSSIELIEDGSSVSKSIIAGTLRSLYINISYRI